MTVVIDGPAWAQPGLDQRAGRYPLAVEAPVLNMTATLLPGLSTQTQFARYYGLYWALADHAERAGLDADACQRLVRRSELLLAYVTDHQNGRDVVAHGADAMARGLDEGRPFWTLAETGDGHVLAPRVGLLGAVRRTLRISRHRQHRRASAAHVPASVPAGRPDVLRAAAGGRRGYRRSRSGERCCRCCSRTT